MTTEDDGSAVYEANITKAGAHGFGSPFPAGSKVDPYRGSSVNRYLTGFSPIKARLDALDLRYGGYRLPQAYRVPFSHVVTDDRWCPDILSRQHS